jgi:Rrf2 family protein
MIHLAERFDDRPVSTKAMAKMEEIPYPLACKMMQKLQRHKLVKSVMGPKGGFQLNKKPSKISLFEVIKVIQGPMTVNRCSLDTYSCPRKSRCPINGKMTELQDNMKMYLENISLDELLKVKNEKQ